MFSSWQNSTIIFLQTLNQILTAGIAITAFSLLLYALAFNLRDRVARSFALIMSCVVVTFTSEAIGSTANQQVVADFWLHFQWVGIVFLPAAYLHFSDAVLEITGKPSRKWRRMAVRLGYFGGFIFLLGLPNSLLVGPVVFGQLPGPHLQPTLFTDIFVVAYWVAMLASWFNFLRAYRRTTTATSRRRIFYLMLGSVSPVIGAFPFLPYNPNFAAEHIFIFSVLAVLVNIVVGVMLVIMAYVVAFFGVSWPDRVVKVRLFKWIMRGPFTASLTLAFVTITRRAGEVSGSSYIALVPIVMVGTILLCEYLITLFSSMGQRWLFPSEDQSELAVIRTLENQLLTHNDLRQFLETILATVCDRLQAGGAYIVAFNPESDGLELMVKTGQTRFQEQDTRRELSDELLERISGNGFKNSVFRWGEDEVFPLMNGTDDHPDLLGLLGISGPVNHAVTGEDHSEAMEMLVQRATMSLRDWRIQQKVFQSIETLSPQIDLIQRLRAAGQYNRKGALVAEELLPGESDLINWVKDGLTHYWGGPKLTENPLMKLKVVQDALDEHDGNHVNALRSILRQAIERVRPEGERRFTGEWILYNILEMKFLEGKKVREVALRLAMSEADLYRKQRVAVEAVARVINDMEVQARKGAEN